MAGEDRPAALEFSELGSAGPAGFEVRGSGTATVTTAPLYQPGARYVVETRDGEHATRTVQRADEAGRLHVTVELGPGNPYQQYSPPARAQMLADATDSGLGTVVEDAQHWPVYTARVRVDSARGGALAN